ncbi:MAG: epoxide hydrolase family protein [Alphaproteobacteria bacterium]|jgi:pimeloyl-ACP methyl ester carboxylesterase
MSVRPFQIAVPQEKLDWIERRLREAQWPNEPMVDDPWAYGASVPEMRSLVAYWLDGYDWRAREAEMNRLPHFLYAVEVDGASYDVHFMHVKGKGDNPRPVMIIHGWPGSFVEFLGSIERLTDPAKFGGDPADAVSVVIPSLIGYGFSSKPSRPIGPRTIARAFDRLMREGLGYTDYIAQGGDWGSSVSGWLGYEGEGCAAVHLNFAFGWTNPDAHPETPEEIAAAQKLGQVWQSESGYMVVQSTKPVSLDHAMADSPLGVAAWLVEKFQRWSQLDGGDLWSVYTRDQILDNIMVYLANNSFGTASWLYRGVMSEPVPTGARVTKPVAMSDFPGELARFPRSTLEKSYNIVRWSEPSRGGHFAAMEQPELFVREVQGFVRQLRERAPG